MLKPSLTLAASALILSACGGGASSNGNASGSATASSGGSFDAANACAILPKEKVEAIMGMKVEKATLSSATAATATTPAFSACTYSFAGAGTIGFYARQTPGGETPESIALTRKALTDGMGATLNDTSGLGTHAFTAQPMDQLHVFFGGDKYIYFMANNPPAGKPIAEIERALAAAVIG